MIEDGLIIKDKERVIVNQPMKNTFDNFFNFLKEKKEFDTKRDAWQLTSGSS